jgi:hypothetical protein
MASNGLNEGFCDNWYQITGSHCHIGNSVTDTATAAADVEARLIKMNIQDF